MRDDDSLVELIATAERNLQELKELQIFGGDALKVQEAVFDLVNDSSTEYTLTLTPDDPELGVLPSKCELIWDNPDNNSQMMRDYYISQVYREDGVFEWYIVGSNMLDLPTQLRLQYIGKGTANLVRTS